MGGFSLVALSLTVAPPGTPAQVLAFRIDTHKRQATWATPSHGPPAQRKFRGRPRLRDDRRVVSSVAALDARSIMWQAWHWSLRRPKPKELTREFGARAPKLERFVERFVPVRLAPIAVLRRERETR